MTKWKGVVASYAPSVLHLGLAPLGAPYAAILSIVLAGGIATSASAADFYWDVNGTAIGLGGTGIWNTVAPLWNSNGDGVTGPMVNWVNAPGNGAFFFGSAGTVTLGAPITVDNLTFGATGYTLTGSTLTLSGATPIITTTTGTVAINSVLAGAAGLAKAGGGTLALGGANTFTGDVVVSSGGLTLSGDAALGAAGNGVSLANGTTLGATGSLAATRVVDLVGGTATVSGGPCPRDLPARAE